MDLADYPRTVFGAARRTIGSHGCVAHFPAPLPRAFALPAALVPLLADAEAALGRLAGVGQLLPNPHLLIRPYLLREAVASTMIEGTQASLAEIFELDPPATGPTQTSRRSSPTSTRWSGRSRRHRGSRSATGWCSRRTAGF